MAQAEKNMQLLHLKEQSADQVADAFIDDHIQDLY